MDSDSKKSYLQQRVYDLYGLTPEQCSVPLFIGTRPAKYQCRKFINEKGEECEQYEKDKDGNPIAAPFALFQSDEHDNIRMFPYTLDGKLITYLRDKQPKYSEGDVEDLYFITRMNPEWLKEHPDQPKYKFPGGETKKGTYPFFPPKLYEAYQKKEHVDTVILTEGYMKAMCASVHGAMVIGLGSITLFADSKSKQLYPGIVNFLNVVKPDNIVILYDGDCTDLGKSAMKELESNQTPNLSKRPYSFMNSLLKLKDMLLEFRNAQGNPCELFFAYNNKMLEDEEIEDGRGGYRIVNNSPKAIDDLLCDEAFKEHAQEIIDDLNHPGRPGTYFKKVNLRTCNDTKIRGVFNCSNPEQFYTAWSTVIGNKRFKFNSAVYFYNAAEKKLVQVLDSTLKDYVAIGGEIVLVTEEPIPNAQGASIKFYPKSDKVMNARYGDGTAKRLYQYKYYEDYTIDPCNENYSQEVINPSGYKFFNMYAPLAYKPVEGKWPTIDKLLHQITKNYGEDYYQMLLDWITLTYYKPMQFLPIIMLVSKERGTGKTSFLNLLKYIYGNNAVIGGNDLIMSKFNSLLAGKLIVGVDESTLGDNKEVGEALKYMSTARTMHVEMKGKDKKEMPSFCKFVLCSNEVRKGVFIAKDEIRFWVMRLSPWEEGAYDSDFDDNLESEIQAFLFYLEQRYKRGQMFVKEKEHRMWFAPSRIYNQDLEVMMAGTSSNAEDALNEFMREMFKDAKRLTLHFDVKYLRKNIPDVGRKDETYVHRMLKDMPGVERVPDSGKYKMPFRVTEEMKMKDPSLKEDVGEIIWPSRGEQCRPYSFDAAYFLTPDDYDRLKARAEAAGTAAAAKSTQQSLPLDNPPAQSAPVSQPAPVAVGEAVDPNGRPF